jgi:hypothetical protein
LALVPPPQLCEIGTEKATGKGRHVSKCAYSQVVLECTVHDPDALPADGRQSEAASAIARGVGRCLLAHAFACLPEVTLANDRRADLVAIDRKGAILIVEIKSSLNDFRSDQKWTEYRDFCDRFFFAVAPEFPIAVLPEEAGLILADKYGGEIIRPSLEKKLSAARRKEVIQRFAFASALRLQALADPDLGLQE